MLNSIRTTVTAAIVGVALAGVASSALAETQWEKDHPRRDQVNDRLAKQHTRINKQVAEGDLSKAKAAKLKTEDRQIRKEERLMARQNSGHITKQEQKTLNQQENAVSAQIGK